MNTKQVRYCRSASCCLQGFDDIGWFWLHDISVYLMSQMSWKNTEETDIISMEEARSSSGLGRLILNQQIMGSNPIRATEELAWK